MSVRELRRRFRLIAFRVRRLTRAQALALLVAIRDGTPAQRRNALERLVPELRAAGAPEVWTLALDPADRARLTKAAAARKPRQHHRRFP